MKMHITEEFFQLVKAYLEPIYNKHKETTYYFQGEEVIIMTTPTTEERYPWITITK